MAKHHKINSWNTKLLDQLIEKVLSDVSYGDISLWLSVEHKLEISKTALHRFGKPIHEKFSGLIELGIPIKLIVSNRLAIEAVGIEKVEEELKGNLTKKIASMFVYLHD